MRAGRPARLIGSHNGQKARNTRIGSGKQDITPRLGVELYGMSVTQAAETFGFSRVTFYQALEAFRAEGLPGLLPRQRGPKTASKLTDEVLGFIDRLRREAPGLRAPEMAERVRQRLGLSVHPRSIERALARRAKRGRPTEPA